MTPAEFEPAIPANERPQIHALDLAANGDQLNYNSITKMICFPQKLKFGSFLYSYSQR
jgi:hypothetical protein